MATSYQKVFTYFLQKVSDYAFLNMQQSDLETSMTGWMHSAATKFKRCKQDLTQYDDVAQQFTVATLTDQEIEILATLMVVEYLTPQIVTTQLLKQTIGSKDFNQTSQAAHLKQLTELRDIFKNEADKLIVQYTYDNGDFTKLATSTPKVT
jgi:hypothetical protein